MPGHAQPRYGHLKQEERPIAWRTALRPDTNRLSRAAATAAVIGAIAGLFVLSPWGHGLEQRVGLEALYYLRGPIAPPPDVVVVAMDKRSQEELNLPPTYWDWPRELHVALIDRLMARGAELIVFDVFFRKSKDPMSDARLADAVRRSGRVVLFQNWSQERVPLGDADGVTVQRDMLVSPVSGIAKEAVGMGPFPLPHVPARVDRFWAYKTGVDVVPTLPLVALQAWALQTEYEFRRFAAVAGPPASAAERRYYASPKRSEAIFRLMHSLRTAFRKNPAVAEKAIRLLDGPDFRSLSRSRRAAFRALARLYAGQDDYYLNLHGPARTIRTIPYHRVLRSQGADGGRDLDGKVVFVGKAEFTTTDKEEGFATVYSRADGIDLSGVEILATAFANLLSGNSIEPLDPILSFVLMTLFGTAMVLTILMAKDAWRGAVAVGGMGLAYGATATVAFAWLNIWTPVFTPVVVLPLAAMLVGLAVHYALARRLTEHIVRWLKRVAPGPVGIDVAAGKEPRIGSDLVTGVCLKTDIERFTSLVEPLTSMETDSVTKSYYELVGEPVEERGGAVLRYAGDGVLCAWTFEGDGRQARLQSCLAALEICRAMDRFNRRNAKLQLPVHVGLHGGEFALGLGGGYHLEQVASGDVVNTASRIEGLTRHINARVLASDEVVAGLDELLVRRLGRFRFAGKTIPVAINEVLGPRSDCGPAESALCERFHEMRAVFDAGHWQDAAELAEKILSFHPEDGPSRFYALLARRRLAANVPLEIEDSAIILDQK